MTCLEACDSDVIQMCTRHEATTNDFCFRHLKFTRRCYTTSLGHRANSSVFPVAPLAMMQVDMAIPDEEREDVLNTTSFELLEMTQEQTEVGSRWLKGLVTSRPTTVLPYCAMFVVGIDWKMSSCTSCLVILMISAIYPYLSHLSVTCPAYLWTMVG